MADLLSWESAYRFVKIFFFISSDKTCTNRITAGGSAGLVEILLFHPLDVVKTRLQSQVKGAPDAYKVRCFSIELNR